MIAVNSWHLRGMKCFPQQIGTHTASNTNAEIAFILLDISQQQRYELRIVSFSTGVNRSTYERDAWHMLIYWVS